ncbi:MAG: NAD(P)-dependent glycerol-1-phosphate dehydrogenase, partial [Thermoplasmata archaeon]
MVKFLKIKEMIFPRDIVVGHDALEKLPDLCDKLLEGKALIVEGKKTKKIAGDRVKRLLQESKFETSEIVITSSTIREVKKVQKTIEKEKIDFVVGVGGGKVIDVSKLSAYRSNIPFISVPTAASHDGIASPMASIKDKNSPTSKKAVSPLAIIADTSIIKKAPYRMLSSGCADVISNLSAIKDWELAHRLKNEEFSTYAYSLSKTSAELIMENSDLIKTYTEEGVWIAVKGMIVSGVAMSVANSSRPASGAEHMFSHALDAIAPGKALHGEQCGVGAIMMLYLHGEDWKSVRDILREIGAPTNAKELGIPKKKIVEAPVRAHSIRPDRYTI